MLDNMFAGGHATLRAGRNFRKLWLGARFPIPSLTLLYFLAGCRDVFLCIVYLGSLLFFSLWHISYTVSVVAGRDYLNGC